VRIRRRKYVVERQRYSVNISFWQTQRKSIVEYSDPTNLLRFFLLKRHNSLKIFIKYWVVLIIVPVA
jgi:hypothetical protein